MRELEGKIAKFLSGLQDYEVPSTSVYLGGAKPDTAEPSNRIVFSFIDSSCFLLRKLVDFQFRTAIASKNKLAYSMN